MTYDTGGSDAKFLVLGIFNMFPKALDHGRHSVALQPPYAQGWRRSINHTSTLPPLQ